MTSTAHHAQTPGLPPQITEVCQRWNRGRSAARTLWMSPGGVTFADRMLSKLRRAETGERYAYERLIDQGAPRLRVGETGGAYIRRLQLEEWLRPLRHPGNYAFTFKQK